MQETVDNDVLNDRQICVWSEILIVHKLLANKERYKTRNKSVSKHAPLS